MSEDNPGRKGLLLVVVIALIVGAAIAVFLVLQPGQESPARGESAIYSCPMHPEVVSDRPGDCPKCGMALEKRH